CGAGGGARSPARSGVVYSGRQPARVWYRDELQALSAADHGVAVTYVYTRTAPLSSPRPPGRVDAALVAEASWPPTLLPTCYVCGPTPFVELAAGLLTAAGHAPDPIRTERFGPAGDRR